MTLIENQAVVLFQGDSITDCGRSRQDGSDLGWGYVKQVAERFTSKYPQKEVTFFNRGISGDRIGNLQARWEEDCLDLKPTWVSIYIGINDTWRRYDNNEATSAKDFEDNYRKLIIQTKEKLDAKIVLIEPFLLPVNESQKAWREDLDPKIQAVRELANEFKTLYVPIDGLFAQASTQTGPAYWAPDGVHPSEAGSALIAQAWMQTVQA